MEVSCVFFRLLGIGGVFSIALSVPPLLAQIGYPAGMAPDTRKDAPGQPAPHQTNYQDRLFAQLAAAGAAEVEFGKLAFLITAPEVVDSGAN
jgi:putative membrane protein